MPGFCFNFTNPEAEGVCDNTSANTTNDVDVTWIKAEEHFVQDKTTILSHDVEVNDLRVFGVDIKYVNNEDVSHRLKQEGYKGDVEASLQGDTDLVPGVYEGGMKIWECSLDLVQYLGEEQVDDFPSLPPLSGCRVLELGCGAGIPGVYCLMRNSQVWFNDYNKDVLTEITMANCELNAEDWQKNSRFFSGDWASLENEIFSKEIADESLKFDMILTSETIYNTTNHEKLISIFKNFLKKNGKVVVAAKLFYFGVGGGLKEFRTLVEEAGFTVKTVRKFEDGVKREILLMQHSCLK